MTDTVGNITFSTYSKVEFKPQVSRKLERLFQKITDELTKFMQDGLNGNITIRINISQGGMSRTYVSHETEL